MIYVLCGIPGSGKTTKAIQLAEENNAKLYSYDVIKHNSKLVYFEDISDIIYQNIRDDLLNGYNVIYDAPHTRLKHRNGVLKSISDISCKKILIVMDTALKECLNRNSSRDGALCLPEPIIYNFYNNFEPPTLDEGWDEIVYI